MFSSLRIDSGATTKAMLIRIGMDLGTSAALGPVFPDGRFEYIPIPEWNRKTMETRTYANTTGHLGKRYSEYLPNRLWNKRLHHDPDFEACTYSESSVKRIYLRRMQKGDILAFYAGLKPFRVPGGKEGLYLIGYLVVDEMLDFDSMGEAERRSNSLQHAKNAHILATDLKGLVIIVGNRCALLDRAVKISRVGRDRRGGPNFKLSRKMEQLLGVGGSIQRSVPPKFVTSRRGVSNLMRILSLR